MRAWVFLSQLLDGIDRVRGRLALQFAIIYFKVRFAFDSAAQHLQTRFRGRNRIVLMRRKAGRNKNTPFEPESFQSDPRQNQMGVMHRIEGAAVLIRKSLPPTAPLRYSLKLTPVRCCEFM